MTRRVLTYFFLAFGLICCTSCFEILEEINLNKDGSGRLLLTINMSKSKTKLASLMLLDSVNGHKIPTEDDIELALDDALQHLRKTEGISNISKTKDFENYIFTLSCDFKSVENVNSIFKELIKQQNKKEGTTFTTTNFSFDKVHNTFQRHFSYDDIIKKSFQRLKREDQKIFDDASYTCIYRFEDKVAQVSNANAKIAGNKKAVLLKVDAMSLIMGKKDVKNTIQLTK